MARMLVAYVSGHERVKFWVDAALGHLEVGPEVLFSTLGRTAACGVETVVVAEKVTDWVDELVANMGKGDLRIHETEHWDPDTCRREISRIRVA